MTVSRVQVTIPAVNGIPEDAATNTWYIASLTDHDGGAVSTFAGHLAAFYEDWSNFRAMSHSWAQTTIRAYDMSDPISPGPPKIQRVPFLTMSLGLTATAAASTLPAEVALVMSFYSFPQAGQSQARRRGRVYLGPLAAVAADSSTGRPSTSFVSTIGGAGQNLVTEADVATAYDWVVYSDVNPATPTFAVVQAGWVDNAWDTQRRRGNAPTSRDAFTL